QTARSFFSQPLDCSYFGAGPWPCLNPVGDHFNELIIDSYSLEYSTQTPHRPIGVFACSRCGFTYARLGPDKSEVDRNRYSRILEYGSVWEGELKKEWNSPTLTLNSASKRFKMCIETIKARAAELDLPFPPPSKPTMTPPRFPKKV